MKSVNWFQPEEEALERIKQAKLDLVILDVILNGGLNGAESAMELRSRSDIPIVFITDLFNTDPYVPADHRRGVS